MFIIKRFTKLSSIAKKSVIELTIRINLNAKTFKKLLKLLKL